MDTEAIGAGGWMFTDDQPTVTFNVVSVEGDPTQERMVLPGEITLKLPRDDIAEFAQDPSVGETETRRTDLLTRAGTVVRGLGHRAIGAVESVKDVYNTGKKEIIAASFGAQALLGFNVVAVGTEQFGGNETAISNVGVHIYEHTQNIGYTALGAGGTSFLIQATLGLATSVSVQQFPRTVAKIHEKLSARKGMKTVAPVDPEMMAMQAQPETLQQPDERTSRAGRMNKRFWDAFGLGTSLKAILKDNAEERTFTENAKNVMEDAVLVGGGVAILGAVAASLLTASKTAGGIGQDAARYTIDVITSPYPYIGIFLMRLRDNQQKKTKTPIPVLAEGSRF